MPTTIKRLPRAKPPPLRPRRPEDAFRHKISAEHERLIERVIVAWSRLDDTMQEAIWSFLNVDLKEGRVVTARLDTRFKINILRGLAPLHDLRVRF